MELVSPAGSPSKLAAAYAFGADSAYLGLPGLSLRGRSESFSLEDAAMARARPPGKSLYCALNIVFRPSDLERLERSEELIAAFGFDAFIVSDPGALPFLSRAFPNAALHLSTQAACSNAESARFWRDRGFSRIIPSREASIREIAAIKAAVPDLEIEVFAHGATCMAYSGRCLLSAYLTGRSANAGLCTQSCRWEYRLLEERERPGEFFPVLEGEDFSLILSSRDLCTIDRLKDLADSGVDALKIEGRMKSVYYVAATTRAYRAGIDRLSGLPAPEFDEARKELDRVSHRAYSEGFLFGDVSREAPVPKAYERETLLLGIVKSAGPDGLRAVEVLNSFKSAERLEYLRPGLPAVSDSGFKLFGESGERIETAVHQRPCFIEAGSLLPAGSLILRRA